MLSVHCPSKHGSSALFTGLVSKYVGQVALCPHKAAFSTTTSNQSMVLLVLHIQPLHYTFS